MPAFRCVLNGSSCRDCDGLALKVSQVLDGGILANHERRTFIIGPHEDSDLDIIIPSLECGRGTSQVSKINVSNLKSLHHRDAVGKKGKHQILSRDQTHLRVISLLVGNEHGELMDVLEQVA